MPINMVQLGRTEYMDIATAEGVNERKKHMEVRLNKIGALMRDEVLFLEHSPSEEQVADTLKKPLRFHDFGSLSSGVVDRM